MKTSHKFCETSSASMWILTVSVVVFDTSESGVELNWPLKESMKEFA